MSKLYTASLCLQGHPSTSSAQNQQRAALLDMSCKLHDESSDNSISTFVLPGGTFWGNGALFEMPPNERRQVVQRSDWAQTVMNTIPHDMAVVTGLDITAPQEGEPHAQYSVYLTKKGVQAVSRKIFPTKGEIKQGAFVLSTDYADTSRIVRTSVTKNSVIMHTCYDLFGSVDVLSGKTKPTRLSHTAAPDDRSKMQCYQAFQGMLTGYDMTCDDLVTVNIHDFKQPGRDIFYQRHGIASASAAFDGALVIGAAHFTSTLPASRSQSPLSAVGVAKDHLTARFHRQAHPYYAVSHSMIETNTQKGILRVFAPS